MDGADLKEKIEDMIKSTIADAVEYHTLYDRDSWELEALKSKYMGLLCSPEDFTDAKITRDEIQKTLTERAIELWKSKEAQFGEDAMREIERVILLRNVDEKWMDHLEAMDDLRDSIGLQAYAQRDPLNEYKLSGAELFDDMIVSVRNDTVRGVLTVVPKEKPIERVQVVKPTDEGFMKLGQRKVSRPSKPAPVRNEEKVGRNDPCPCGSGKKYKKCCGANTADGE